MAHVFVDLVCETLGGKSIHTKTLVENRGDFVEISHWNVFLVVYRYDVNQINFNRIAFLSRNNLGKATEE